MKRKPEEIFLRNNTAEAYRGMRLILRGAPPPEQDRQPQSFAWWKVALIIIVIGGVLWLLNSVSFASESRYMASYYSVKSLHQEGTFKRSKGIMANGEAFTDSGLTVATGKQYPLGSTLLVTNRENGRSVLVKVTDRIGKRFRNSRVDLSRGAFQRIASLDKGLIIVSVRQVNINVK